MSESKWVEVRPDLWDVMRRALPWIDNDTDAAIVLLLGAGTAALTKNGVPEPPEDHMPVPHLGGTSLDRLIEQRCDAARTVKLALDLLDEMSPHMRDYPRGGYDAAKQLHERRVQMLRDLWDALHHEAVVLVDYGAARELAETLRK